MIIVYGLIFTLILFGFGYKKAQNKGMSAQPVEREDKSVKNERERVSREFASEKSNDIVRCL